MRFLFNTVCYKPAKGGGGPIHSVSSLAEELVRRGHDVTVVASNLDIPGRLAVDTERDYAIDGVKVRYFNARPTFLQRTGLPMFTKAGVYTFGPEFGRWLELEGSRFDVIHNHISFTWSNGPCARYAARNNRIYVYHQRGNLDPIRLRRGRLKKKIYILLVEKPLMRPADVLIALTEYEVTSFRALGLKNRVEIIPNGIDPELAHARTLQTSERVNHTLDQLSDDMCFFWMSRIHPIKGPDVFVDAFLSCARHNRHVQAVMAGPDEVGLLARLLTTVRAAGLENRFHYVGALAGDDKIALLRRSDCFVLPTLSEGMSMVLLEAMAAGCAVLTTPGANFEEIAHAGAGEILPLSAEAFADAMTRLSKGGRSQAAIMGVRGKTLVREKYSWSTIADRYEQLCAELAQRKVHTGCDS
jgi:glycosyltransferase involved in cell wall biosynthesis